MKGQYRRRRWYVLIATVVAVGVAGTGAAVLVSRHEKAAPSAHARPPLWHFPEWFRPSTTLANISGPTPGYDNPFAANVVTTIEPKWGGAPLALPVEASVPGWHHVGLVGMPGSPPSAWVHADAVSLTRTPYRLVVDTARTRLLVFADGLIDFCTPVAIGTADHPTPLGHHFVVLFAQPPNPRYGAFVLVTSAFTNALTDWQQLGHPTVTVEGPVDSAAAIGTTGARVTTGGVRLLEPDLERLRDVPAGTPLDVVDSFDLERVVGANGHRHVEHSAAVDHVCPAVGATHAADVNHVPGHTS
jgi:hypothetical protein